MERKLLFTYESVALLNIEGSSKYQNLIIPMQNYGLTIVKLLWYNPVYLVKF